MTHRLPRNRERTAVVAAFLTLLATGRALEVTAWQNRQTVSIDRAGLVKFALPPATLDRARPALEDLRVLDPAGREVAFAVERAAAAETPAVRASRAFRAELSEGATQITIETGTTAPLVEVMLASPAPAFLKAARVELSANGRDWQPLRAGVPLFRQFGAEQLRIDLDRRTAAYVRVTIDDTRTRPVPIVGAAVASAATTLPAVTTPLPVRVLAREEFAGESVLTLDLGGAHVALAAVTFAPHEGLFTRRVTFAVRELAADGTTTERTLASGVIYRVAVDGLAPSERLQVPAEFDAPSRELLVRIQNGDSPPLTFDEVRASECPIWIVFAADAPGTYLLLTGNRDAPAPRYDLASLGSALKDAAPRSLAIGPVEGVPGYRHADTLANVVARGAALDPSPWAFRKPVEFSAAGVQQLELDLDVLSGAQRSLADLRLVRDGAQVPYLLERSSLLRSIPLTPVPAPDSKRPSLSRWEIKLPRAGAPLARLTLTSPDTLFQRHVRLYEKLSDDRGGSFERVLGEAEWNKTPGNERLLVIALSTSPATATLWLATDNGDNPALKLGDVMAAYPVARLLFKADAPLDLFYGNAQAAMPRYDLALAAAQILAAEKHVATLGPEEKNERGASTRFALARGPGALVFWGVLALVVVVLLVVVAKLLPKAPPG